MDDDKPYSNREIREKWHETANTLQEIRIQTKATNGRVTELEKWQYISMGAVAVISVIVVPLLAWALYVLSNIQQTVHTSVDQALSAYNIKAQ